MLLNAIATVILVGMMLIPLVNIAVGAIAGAGIGGLPGGLFGILLGLAISAAEKWVADRLGWWDIPSQIDSGAGAMEDHRSDLATAAAITGPPTIRTGPPTGRRKPRRAMAPDAPRRPARSNGARVGSAR
jgi:hypothetical protein